MRLLSSLTGIHAAGFSLMKPNAEIYKHSVIFFYYYYYFFNKTFCFWAFFFQRTLLAKSLAILAFHLGLDVPSDGESLLFVKDKTGKEVNGKVLIFDATYEHSAINKANENRTILYIDFEMQDQKDENWN